mmetsp:Transcript_47115/g.106761  ORF Transcript_47115/g.106761 Transcript_47115/m.106761 type:complete len:99 (-) Transcript_47115:349-645(-)|eukprot:CAMPEP_0172595216 /NCGR_PEP_ID=MMETSP1068-20121228/14786_1 /TAXON_ID=35684 /ORGANISM="Pseudopedinella elastica, Strain CCMP716" /LENGTH=98 /DNA_ID=CAMNT_0013393651 /DNA_START=58 /DNA_END=354 /DNA_ORIENTATION=-
MATPLRFVRPAARAVVPRRTIFAAQDAWRRHPMLSGCIKEAFPGLGYASAIFGTYLLFSTAGSMFGSTPHGKEKKFKFEQEEVGAMPSGPPASSGGHH